MSLSGKSWWRQTLDLRASSAGCEGCRIAASITRKQTAHSSKCLRYPLLLCVLCTSKAEVIDIELEDRWFRVVLRIGDWFGGDSEELQAWLIALDTPHIWLIVWEEFRDL